MQEKTLKNLDPKSKPEHIRVTETFEETGLMEIVDAWLTSRRETAQELEVFAKIVLTRADAEWLRDTLCEMLPRASSPAPTATTATAPPHAPRGEGSSTGRCDCGAPLDWKGNCSAID